MLIVNNLFGFGARRASSSAFDPISLFASGEVGALYDRSDLSTMFQENFGTTPVTADGQSIGRCLDKSKGLALGSELVDTANTTSDWAVYGSNTLVAESGALKLTYVGGADAEYGATLWLRSAGGLSSDLTAGKTYKITLDAKITGGSATFKMADALGNISTSRSVSESDYVTYSWIIKANADTYINLNASFSSGEVFYIKNISVKEQLGNHAIQATTSLLPLKTSTGTADWVNYDGVDDVLTTTFQSSLGSSCTVARANVGSAPTILTSQTIGTSYDDSTDNAALIIINRALTGQETTDVTAWLTAKGATS